MLWNLVRKDMMLKFEFLEVFFLFEIMLGGFQYIKYYMILIYIRFFDLEVQFDVNLKLLLFNREVILIEDVVKLRFKYVGVSFTDDLMNQLLKGKLRGYFQEEVELEIGQQFMELEKKVVIYLGVFFCNVVDRLGVMEMVSLCFLGYMQVLRVKLVVQLINKNQYCYGFRNLFGLYNMKRRQLNRFGYRVVELFYWEWFLLLKRIRLEKLVFFYEKVFIVVF